MNKIEQFARAIESYENMDKSYNNPGALRWSKFQSGTRRGFSVFPSYEIGFNALMFQLQIACDGRSKKYKPSFDMYQFFEIYAPSFENNSRKYADTVAMKLKINPNDPISQLL